MSICIQQDPLSPMLSSSSRGSSSADTEFSTASRACSPTEFDGQQNLERPGSSSSLRRFDLEADVVVSAEAESVPASASSSSSPAADASPVQRYRLRKRLRQSLFGEVFVADDLTTSRKVAVKVSMRSLLDKGLSSAGVSVLEDCRKEADIQRMVSGHPHIVELIDTHDDGERFWVVQEYVSGGDLFDLVVRHGHFGEDVARHFFLCMLAGLQHLHHRGVVHLDLSLENLVANEQGFVKICDFGVARQFSHPGETWKATGNLKPGKLKYMAPEILAEQEFNGIKADIFSAGVVLFTLLTGHPPFERPSVEDPRFLLIAQGKLWYLLAALRMTNRVPAGARDLISKMLSLNPADRFDSVDEIIAQPWVREGLQKQ